MAGRDPQCIPSKHTDTTRLIRFVLKPVSFGANLIGFGWRRGTRRLRAFWLFAPQGIRWVS